MGANTQVDAAHDFRAVVASYFLAVERQEVARKKLAEATKAANAAHESLATAFQVFEARVSPAGAGK